MAWFCHGKMTPMKRRELMRGPARKELVNAMKVLMKHHIVENITVSQICQQADLSRQTFYCFSPDKYDLINWLINCR